MLRPVVFLRTLSRMIRTNQILFFRASLASVTRIHIWWHHQIENRTFFADKNIYNTLKNSPAFEIVLPVGENNFGEWTWTHKLFLWRWDQSEFDIFLTRERSQLKFEHRFLLPAAWHEKKLLTSTIWFITFLAVAANREPVEEVGTFNEVVGWTVKDGPANEEQDQREAEKRRCCRRQQSRRLHQEDLRPHSDW